MKILNRAFLKVNASWLPMVVVATLLSLSLSAILLAEVITDNDVCFSFRLVFGFDYFAYHTGSLALLNGGSPYDVWNFVIPPTFAWLNLPLVFLPFAQARLVIAGMIFLAAPVCLWAVIRHYSGGSKKTFAIMMVSGIIVLLNSYPFFMQVDRLNVDIFVICLLMLGVFRFQRNTWLCALCLGFAVALKLYPVLVFIPLVTFRRWRIVFATLLVLAAIVIATPGLWFEFVTNRLFDRANLFITQENGSIANFCWHVDHAWKCLSGAAVPQKVAMTTPVLISAAGVYLSLLGVVSLASVFLYKRRGDLDWPSVAAMFFPFMVALPQVAYCYELQMLVVLLPVAGAMVSGVKGRSGWVPAVLMTIGVLLSQTQVVGMETLCGAQVFRVINSIGVVTTMVASVLWMLLCSRGIQGPCHEGLAQPCPPSPDVS